MCFLIKKPKVEPELIVPTSTKRITIDELNTIIKGRFPDCELYLSDLNYLLCSYDDVAFFLAQDETNKMTYISEKRDCDDFAYRLMGQFSIPEWSDLCLGIIWTANHAFNVFITEDKEILFIEPQTDTITPEVIGGANVRMMVI